MRVLYFTGAYRPDSMVSHTHGELVAALRARGVAMEIATIGARDQPEPLARETDTYGTVVWRIRPPSGAMSRIRRAYSAHVWAFPPFEALVRSLRAFLTAERIAQYDLFHVGMAFPYATAFRHAMRGRAAPPAIVTITGGDILTDEGTGYGYGRLPTTRRAIQRTLRWAALVQANSPHSARVVAAYGCPIARVAVQPPQSPHATVAAADLADFRAASRAALESSGAIPPGRLLFGLGRMVPIKGYDDVIRALPAIRRTHPDVTLMFAGPARDAAAATYVASLESLAASLGVRDHVRIAGQIPFDAVPRYFAAAEIALIPSLIDGLNKTGIEAGAVGTPSLVSETAGLADYVAQFAAGAVVPPRNPEALAAAILRLLGDDAAWRAASSGAVRMADAFSLDRTADGVLALYERLLVPS
ncbi:MAG: glycosyltransferase family 4 protein [Thermomicrobiales bacterium]